MTTNTSGKSKRVCLVTGSSAGIGASTALWFAQRDHDVVINYSKGVDAAEAVAAQCRAAGADALVVKADIGDKAQCEGLADAAASHFGHVDVLVNNAGTSTKVVSNIKDLDALEAEDFLASYNVNVIGTFQMTRLVAPLMKGRANASVINVSSMAAVMGAGSSIAYASSKGALNSLTLCLARALAPSIRVNAVLPGLVNSDWMRNRIGEDEYQVRRKRYESRALLGEVIQPEEAARAIWFLANDGVTMTGQLLNLDAGFMMG